MKTSSRFPRLRGVSVCGATLLCALAFTAPALAAKSDTTRQPVRRQLTVRKAKCYVMSSASAIPLQCDRFGGIPTTTIPILIIGGSRGQNGH